MKKTAKRLFATVAVIVAVAPVVVVEVTLMVLVDIWHGKYDDKLFP